MLPMAPFAEGRGANRQAIARRATLSRRCAPAPGGSGVVAPQDAARRSTRSHVDVKARRTRRGVHLRADEEAGRHAPRLESAPSIGRILPRRMCEAALAAARAPAMTRMGDRLTGPRRPHREHQADHEQDAHARPMRAATSQSPRPDRVATTRVATLDDRTGNGRRERAPAWRPATQSCSLRRSARGIEDCKELPSSPPPAIDESGDSGRSPGSCRAPRVAERRNREREPRHDDANQCDPGGHRPSSFSGWPRRPSVPLLGMTRWPKRASPRV